MNPRKHCSHASFSKNRVWISHCNIKEWYQHTHTFRSTNSTSLIIEKRGIRSDRPCLAGRWSTSGRCKFDVDHEKWSRTNELFPLPADHYILRESVKETGGERKIGCERRIGGWLWWSVGRSVGRLWAFIDQRVRRRRLLLFRTRADRLRGAHTRPHKVSFHPFAYFCMINGGRFWGISHRWNWDASEKTRSLVTQCRRHTKERDFSSHPRFADVHAGNWKEKNMCTGERAPED